MTTPVAVTQFAVKSHSSPDEVRNPEKTRVEIVRLEGFTLGRLSFEPGWRWSECIKPVAQTDSCQVSHVGYAVAGRVTVPPGHDAWVEGDEPFVGIEVMSAEQFAMP